MLAKAVQVTANYSFDLTGRIPSGQTLVSIDSVVISPSDTLTATGHTILGGGKSIRSTYAGGLNHHFYSVTYQLTTDAGYPVVFNETFAVLDSEAIARCLTVLNLLNEYRLRIHDHNKNAVVDTTGCLYKWECDDSDLLISNERAIYFLNQARQEYARRVPFFDDATSYVCTLPIRPGQQSYGYDSRIQTIKQVVLESTGTDLIKTTLRDLYSRYDGPPDTDLIDCKGLSGYYVEDPKRRTLTLSWDPVEDDSLLLTVERGPLTQLCWENRHELIIEPDFSYTDPLVEYMAYLTYRTKDTQLYDRQEASAALEAFTERVGPPVSVRAVEADRQMQNMGVRLRPAPYFKLTRRVERGGY